MIIAIDGPAGAGKSSVAKMLSKLLNFEYIDTGAMYRAFALKIKNSNCSYIDIEEIITLLDNTKINFYNGHIFLDEIIVDSEIRTEEISLLSSKIAELKLVRTKMVEIQRNISQNKNVVLDGRDIGTYVFPEAEFKFFLTASNEVRGKRRYDEMINKGMNITLDQVVQDIKNRDYNDSNREFAPLKPASDAFIINTTSMTLEQVTDFIAQKILEDKNVI